MFAGVPKSKEDEDISEIKLKKNQKSKPEEGEEIKSNYTKKKRKTYIYKL